MKRRQNHFQRRLVLELGMSVNRDATPVVANGEGPICEKLNLDPGGVTGDGLVHGVIEYFRRQMMTRALVCAANIHAGAEPDRLQSFKDLNILGGVIRVFRFRLLEKIGHKAVSLT